MPQFQFQNLSDFLSMAGHGSYVWFAYVITFAAMIQLLVSPLLQTRRLKQQARRQQLIDAAESTDFEES